MKRIWTTLFLTAVVLAAVLTPLSADAYALNDRNKPLSREILTEGMVLLKNEADALPLASIGSDRRFRLGLRLYGQNDKRLSDRRRRLERAYAELYAGRFAKCA